MNKVKKLISNCRLNNRGQIAVEYVLLLTVAVGMSALITKTVVNRNPENPGFLITKWRNILVVLGADYPDDPYP